MTTKHHKADGCLCKPIHTRQLKVREAYHSYQLSQNTPQRTPIGEIHLKSHWLIQAGFTIDTPVTVKVTQGRLVVTADNKC